MVFVLRLRCALHVLELCQLLLLFLHLDRISDRGLELFQHGDRQPRLVMSFHCFLRSVVRQTEPRGHSLTEQLLVSLQDGASRRRFHKASNIDARIDGLQQSFVLLDRTQDCQFIIAKIADCFAAIAS